jgi:hypothetical protein
MDARYSGNFIDILNALDRLDLRDDANVVVGSCDVVVVFGIERCVGYAWCECPRTEGAVAKGCW